MAATATKGRLLLPSTEEDESTPRPRRGKVLVALGVAGALVIAGLLAIRHVESASRPASVPQAAVVVVPTTEPYRAHRGPGATTVLTEAVDGLTLAVPATWKSAAADPLALSALLAALAGQSPPLATLLQAETEVAVKAAIRLFAYHGAAPSAFVSVISFASPAAQLLTPDGVAAVVAVAKKKSPNVAVSGERLAVGEVIKLDSSLVSEGKGVVIEDLVFVATGRTILVEIVSETDVAAVPPVFAQIGQSLRLN